MEKQVLGAKNRNRHVKSRQFCAYPASQRFLMVFRLTKEKVDLQLQKRLGRFIQELDDIQMPKMSWPSIMLRTNTGRA